MITHQQNDTICALSTPAGTGALAVIRISGPRAFEICDRVFSRSVSSAPSHTVLYGKLRYASQLIDEVVVSVFRGPGSFTGQDTVEISCHGSKYIRQRVLEAFVEAGCRMATPGEYTMRAYLNGKMDLAQAEAVADLIASESRAAHKLAMHQMRGGYSSEINELREKLIEFAALIELELDFGEEDVEFADRASLRGLVVEILKKTEQLSASFSSGKAIKDGIPVAIIGEPNVGKSTLLNAILKEDKAIVSDIAGTTRDVIEDTIHIDGMLFRFIDTAGLRETTDTIEKLGIARTYTKVDQAQVIFYLTDAVEDSKEKIHEMLHNLQQRIEGQDKQLFVLANKVDKAEAAEEKMPVAIRNKYRDIANVIYLSALRNQGVEELVEKLSEIARQNLSAAEGSIVSNARHHAALQKTAKSLHRVLAGLDQKISGDFLAMDIRQGMHALGEITGSIDMDRDVLGAVFSRFCIGK